MYPSAPLTRATVIAEYRRPSPAHGKTDKFGICRHFHASYGIGSAAPRRSINGNARRVFSDDERLLRLAACYKRRACRDTDTVIAGCFQTAVPARRGIDNIAVVCRHQLHDTDKRFFRARLGFAASRLRLRAVKSVIAQIRVDEELCGIRRRRRKNRREQQHRGFEQFRHNISLFENFSSKFTKRHTMPSSTV